jgi:hypothetical protein
MDTTTLQNLYARLLANPPDPEGAQAFSDVTQPAVNAALPYVQAYAKQGVPGVLNQAGIQTPRMMQTVGNVVNNPDYNAAMGMAAPIKAFHGSPYNFDQFSNATSAREKAPRRSAMGTISQKQNPLLRPIDISIPGSIPIMQPTKGDQSKISMMLLPESRI